MVSATAASLLALICFGVTVVTVFLHRHVPYGDEQAETATFLRSMSDREDKILAAVEQLSAKVVALDEADPTEQVLSKVVDVSSSLTNVNINSDSSHADSLLAKVEQLSDKVAELEEKESAATSAFGEMDTCQRVQASPTSTYAFMPYGAGCPHHPMSYTPKPLSISTIVPGLARPNFLDQFPTLLGSIAKQTVQPDEVVVAISGVFEYVKVRYAHRLPPWEDIGDNEKQKSLKFCKDTLDQFTQLYTKAPIKLICIGERLTAGRTRMVAVRSSSSDIMGMVDADDTELSIRNQVIKNVFGPTCSKEGERMVLLHSARQRRTHEYEKRHGYEKVEHNRYLPAKSNATCVFDEEGLEAYDGHALYRKVINDGKGWRISNGVAYGHPVVRRKGFDMAMYASISNGEDALFLRDLLQQLGPNPGVAMYLHRPLTTYFTPGHGNSDIIPKSITKSLGKKK